MIAGGCKAIGIKPTFHEILTGDLVIKQLPNLEKDFTTSMVSHNGMILLRGGYAKNEKKCFQFDQGLWKEHSIRREKRISHSTVITQTAIFLFGGEDNWRTTYEYLLKDSTQWLMGKTKIPEGFINGYAIEIKSRQEIWLIGGCETGKRILSFNVNDHTFQELPFHLNEMRVGHRCAFIPNTNKIMVTGGQLPGKTKLFNSTEILDTEDGSVSMASPLKHKRVDHGIATITINGEERLAVFGGISGTKRLDSVELYNIHTKKWETSEIKLKEPRSHFSFFNVKLSELIP